MDNTDSHTEVVILSYIVQNPNYLKFLTKNMFSFDLLNTIVEEIKTFYYEFKEMPTETQLRNQMTLKNGDDLDFDVTQAISEIYNHDYIEDEWCQKTTQGFIQSVTLKKNMTKAAEYLSSIDISLSNADEAVNKALDMIDATRQINFDTNLGSNFFDPESHKPKKLQTVPYTFSSIDRAIGGIEVGTLTVYLGVTNVGKSVFLCNDAAFYVKQGKNVLYITCEMSEQRIGARIARNLLNLTGEEYEAICESKSGIKREMDKFKTSMLNRTGNLWIKQYPQGTCTTIDIDNYIKTIEDKEGFKVHVVLVDYIGIMANYRSMNSDNTYNSLKYISQDLRAVAVKQQVSVITACQLNRGAYDSMNDVEIKNISESKAVADNSDTILGIIQNDAMREDNTYKLKPVKVRDGKRGDIYCKIDVDYDKMQLSERLFDDDEE